uniref:Plus3 domain-containing protein n=1 Tax=Strongyloides venezuelensis TaxID=75913 RepID=A0A0K0G380_STRVS
MDKILRLMKVVTLSGYRNYSEICNLISFTDIQYFGKFKLSEKTYDETIKILLQELNQEFRYSIVELKPKNIHTSTPVFSRNKSINNISTCISSIHGDTTNIQYFGKFKLSEITYDETIKILLQELNEEFGYSIVELKPKNIHTSTPVFSRNKSINDISTCISSIHGDTTSKSCYENPLNKSTNIEKDFKNDFVLNKSTNDEKEVQNDFILNKSNDTGISTTMSAAIFSPQLSKVMPTNENKQQINFVEINKPDDLMILDKTAMEGATKIINSDEVFTYVIVRRDSKNKLRLTRRKMPSNTKISYCYTICLNSSIKKYELTPETVINIHTDDVIMINLLSDIFQGTKSFTSNITPSAAKEMCKTKLLIDKIKKLNVLFIKNIKDSQLINFADKKATKLLQGNSLNLMKTIEETSFLNTTSEN